MSTVTTKLVVAHRAADDIISSALMQNYGVIAVCVVLIAAAAAVLYVVGVTAWATYAQFKTMTDLSRTSITAKTQAEAVSKTDGTTVDDPHADNEVWNAQTLASDPPLSVNDATRIRSAMTRLKGRYAAYNQALTVFDRDVKGREPDDLMDEKILSQSNDDYVYEDKANRQRDSRMQTRGQESYPA